MISKQSINTFHSALLDTEHTIEAFKILLDEAVEAGDLTYINSPPPPEHENCNLVDYRGVLNNILIQVTILSAIGSENQLDFEYIQEEDRTDELP